MPRLSDQSACPLCLPLIRMADFLFVQICSQLRCLHYLKLIALHGNTSVLQMFCLQIVELVEADVEAMPAEQISRLCTSLLPDAWLTAPPEVSSIHSSLLWYAASPHIGQQWHQQGCHSGSDGWVLQ